MSEMFVKTNTIIAPYEDDNVIYYTRNYSDETANVLQINLDLIRNCEAN